MNWKLISLIGAAVIGLITYFLFIDEWKKSKKRKTLKGKDNEEVIDLLEDEIPNDPRTVGDLIVDLEDKIVFDEDNQPMGVRTDKNSCPVNTVWSEKQQLCVYRDWAKEHPSEV